jgi:hypothetical protein
MAFNIYKSLLARCWQIGSMNKFLPSKKISLMKRILSVVTIAAVMAASCNTTPKTDTVQTAPAIQPIDTFGLAQYQQWKAQNELANPNAYMNQQAAEQPTRTIVKYVPVRGTTTTRRSSSSGSMSSSSSNTAQASRKKGWSKSAKGAVIGGVGGAVAGAVINKRNRAVGAVIGGVLGAGAGYGIGRGMDKKDGRY